MNKPTDKPPSRTRRWIIVLGVPLLVFMLFKDRDITPAQYAAVPNQKAWQEQQAQRAAKEATFKQQQSAELQACKANRSCWAERNISTAKLECTRQIEARAKYQFKWEDGMFTPMFSRHQSGADFPKSIVYYGDKLLFQNGFGAWQRIEYACLVNTETNKATAYVGQDITQATAALDTPALPSLRGDRPMTPKILRCIAADGAVSYTQTACPAGSHPQ